MRLDYGKEKFTKVRVCGIECDFSDMRTERSTVPKKRYQYEVAGDDDSGGNPSRVRHGSMVNSFGTLFRDISMLFGHDGELSLDDGHFVYL